MRRAQPWRPRLEITEQPGSLVWLVRALASLHVYIVAVQIVGTATTSERRHRTDCACFSHAGRDPGSCGAVRWPTRLRRGGSPDDALDLPTRASSTVTAMVKTEIAPLAAALNWSRQTPGVASAVEVRTTVRMCCVCSGPLSAT